MARHLDAVRDELNQREEVVKERKRELQEAELTLVVSKRDPQKCALSTALDEVESARAGLKSARELVNALMRQYARLLEASSGAAGACVRVRACAMSGADCRQD